MQRLFLRYLICLLILPAALGMSAAQAKAGPKTPPSLSASWSSALAPVWRHVYNLKTSQELPRRLAGDGTTDDLPALNTDFQWLASNGGGVLYAPAGTYHLDNVGPQNFIIMSGASVLEGDGISQTIFHYTSTASGLVRLRAPNVCGFYKLSMICDAPEEQSPYQMQAMYPTVGILYGSVGNGVAQDVFLKSVKWDIGSGRGLEIRGITNMDVEDSTFLGLHANHGTVNFGGGTNLLVTRNLFHYKSGRVVCNATTGLIFTHNRVIRVGGIHTPRIESGGLECSYSQPALVAYNFFTVDGLCDQTNGDGETILTQYDAGSGGFKRFTDNGIFTIANPTSLTDNSKVWELDTWPITTMAVITSGPGLGQVRKVVNHHSSSVTVSPAWKTVPSVGDHYTLLSFPAKDMVIKNNTLENTAQGIIMYSGSYNVSITGNTLTNANSIVIRAADQLGRQQPALDNIIAHNKVTNPNGQNFSAVGLLAFQSLAIPHGVLTYGNTVIKNIIGKHPSGASPNGAQQQGINEDGIYSKVVIHPEIKTVIKDTVPSVTNGR